MVGKIKLYNRGNRLLMRMFKTAFLCSRNVPDELSTRIIDWAERIPVVGSCVMCGNHSQMEQAVFSVLLRREVPVILVLAETIEQNWGDEIENAIASNRLLMITHCDNTMHFSTFRSAADRNMVMLALADEIVVGYSRHGGNIDRQVSGMENVTFLGI